MFIIELTYTADLTEIDAHMGAHMEFLRRHYDSGQFVFSGRKVPRDGGIIVATGSDREEIEELAREDPFHQHGLAEFRIVEFRASQCAADLPKRLHESRSQRLNVRCPLAVMHGPDVAKGRTAPLQEAANDTFQILKDAALDAGEVDVVEARRLGTVAWSFLDGTAMLTNNQQIPPTVSATPERLVELGLRHLFHSFRRAARADRPSGGES